jgi:hypothetical protein
MKPCEGRQQALAAFRFGQVPYWQHARPFGMIVLMTAQEMHAIFSFMAFRSQAG